jgi:hypothetical protein
MLCYLTCAVLLIATDDTTPAVAATNPDIAAVNAAFQKGRSAINTLKASAKQSVVNNLPTPLAYSFECSAIQSTGRMLFIANYPAEMAKAFVDFPRARQVLLFDGQKCHVASFSDSIRPNGCATTLFPTVEAAERKGLFLVKSLLEVKEWFPKGIGEINAERFSSRRDASGEIVLSTLPGEKRKIEIRADPNVGFNISQITMHHNATRSIRKTAWQQVNHVWCPRTIDQEVHNNAGLLSSWKVEYTTMEPNVEVKDCAFDLTSLTAK